MCTQLPWQPRHSNEVLEVLAWNGDYVLLEVQQLMVEGSHRWPGCHALVGGCLCSKPRLSQKFSAILSLHVSFLSMASPEVHAAGKWKPQKPFWELYEWVSFYSITFCVNLSNPFLRRLSKRPCGVDSHKQPLPQQKRVGSRWLKGCGEITYAKVGAQCQGQVSGTGLSVRSWNH